MVERLLYTEDVAGSNPVLSTTYLTQVGSVVLYSERAAFPERKGMAKRQHRDSVQEKAVTNENKKQEYSAGTTPTVLKNVTKLEVGDLLVHGVTLKKTLKVEKVRELVWSRRNLRCTVNNSAVYDRIAKVEVVL